MKTTQNIEQNTGQRKRNSSSFIGNTYAHTCDVNIHPFPHISSPFTGVLPPFGTPQAILLRLAQLEAQLVLNMISNFTAGNHSSGNPFAPLCLLQAAGTQKNPFLTMYQPSNVALSHLLHRGNVNNITHTVNPPSSNGTMMSSVTEIHAMVNNTQSWIATQGKLKAKEVIQETKTGLGLSSNTTQPKKPCDRFNANPVASVESFQCKPISAIKGPTVTMSTDGQVSKTLPYTALGEGKSENLPSENLSMALASLGLSLEDLELLSYCPDDHLTTEMLPHIIQDMQQQKQPKDTIQSSPESEMPRRVIEYGHTSMTSNKQVKSPREIIYTYGKHHTERHQKKRHSRTQEDRLMSQSRPSSSSTSPALHSPYGHPCDIHSQSSLKLPKRFCSSDLYKKLSPQSRVLKRDSSGRRLRFISRRLQCGVSEVSIRRPASVYVSSPTMKHSFISSGCNTARNDKTHRPRSITLNAMRKCHNEFSFSYVTSGITSESMKIQTPVNKENAKTRGLIRMSGIPLDFPESELIQMAAPFGQPVEILIASEVDMVTHLEWKRALVMLPTEVSAQEMVKVYSAIPLHMRQQSLELVSQTVDLTSPLSVFHAFVGPSTSNGLLTPVDHLLVVCNVPHQPSAVTGVLRLLKPFGKVSRTLVFYGNKVDIDQCLGKNNCIQLVLEMDSSAVALSVYEWSQKVPCIYHNHHLSFFRWSNIEKNNPELFLFC
ncbi:uncharacterized protein [Misgurnus anguillicaudatus]|uniref:uncharacterized protein n=1 Tax=Misgurnus anguillicaudatus TaxID=75329 RepID=UPI003CCEFF4E